MTKHNGAAYPSSASDAPSRPARRKTDTENYSKFRPSRFFKSGGKWYFATREGTMEGPYDMRREAEYKLESYIKVMVSAFASADSQISIHPLEEPALYESSPLS
jgi:hypothetical protein